MSSHPVIGEYIQDHYDSLSPEEKARLDVIYREVREMCQEYESSYTMRNGRMLFTIKKKDSDEATV